MTLIFTQFWPVLSFCLCPQPMFSVTPSLATNVNAAAAAAAAFNPYLGPVSPGLMPADILPGAPVLVTSNPSVQVPAAATAAAQKLMRTDRLEVRHTFDPQMQLQSGEKHERACRRTAAPNRSHRRKDLHNYSLTFPSVTD